MVMGVIGKPDFKAIVADLEVGGKGFIPHSALDFNLNEIPYLNIGALVTAESRKGSDIPIERTGEENYGYSIDLTATGYIWRRTSTPFYGQNLPNSQIVQLPYNPSHEEIPEDYEDGIAGYEDGIAGDVERALREGNNLE